MRESSKKQSWAEIFQKQRRDWGDIHPATKVIPSKKLYKRKSKHKGKEDVSM